MAPKLAPLLLLLVLALCACEKTPPPSPSAPETQRFEVRGILKSIVFADREVIVEHEEIPGYMPAMTMPFSVKEMREVEPLSAGDAIAFHYIVTQDDSWITGIRKIERSAVKLPETKPARNGQSGERLREGDSLPSFSLTDEQDRAINAETFRGKPLVITFIFTRCPVPNYCPLMSKRFAELHAATAADPELAQSQLLSVSIDPAHDTPKVLAKYAESCRSTATDRWRFATGDPEEVNRLTSGFSIQVKPAGGTIEHGLATVLVDPGGVIRNIWRGNGWRVEEVLESLRQL